MIINIIRGNPFISGTLIVEVTGIPKSTVDRIISGLKRNGIIMHQGTKKVVIGR